MEDGAECGVFADDKREGGSEIKPRLPNVSLYRERGRRVADNIKNKPSPRPIDYFHIVQQKGIGCPPGASTGDGTRKSWRHARGNALKLLLRRQSARPKGNARRCLKSIKSDNVRL